MLIKVRVGTFRSNVLISTSASVGQGGFAAARVPRAEYSVVRENNRLSVS
jgi:hypothetical protein